MNLENNKKIIELKTRIGYLQNKINHVTVDLCEGISKEIKALQEELRSLPSEQVFAGDIYLSKKTVFVGPRYNLREYKGKLWLYEENECITDRIGFDAQGIPINAKVFKMSSQFPDGVEYLFNFQIDKPIIEKSQVIPYKLELHQKSWKCPVCLNEVPIEMEFCFVCPTVPRPSKEDLAITA